MRALEANEVEAWVREVLLDPRREKPIVAVTTRPRTDATWLEPRELAAALGDLAEVVCLETGDPTWELADALPPRLDVYGGAVRIWWPGLRPDSDPYDHRLFIIHSPAEARSVQEQIVASIRSDAPQPEPAPSDPIDVEVESVSGTTVVLAGGGLRGELRRADVPLAELARSLSPGDRLRARPLRDLGGNRREFSVHGLLPSTWAIAGGSVAVGDVVTGRVQSTRGFGAFIEILPRVSGLCHISELDWTFVDDVDDFVRPGQVLPVRILAIDAEEQKLELSVKRALGAAPAPLPPLVPGGRPFVWSDEAARPKVRGSDDDLTARLASLDDELEAAVTDRVRLAEANKLLRDQVRDLKKQVRGTEDRLAGLERKLAPELDPLASERGFLLGVRLAYARLFDEGDRHSYPLLKMRVGKAFLDSLRDLDGIDVDKVVEVCAQVAAGAAHELASRDVHQLRDGPRGSGTRTRSSDRAQAWRCALQVNTPSARRLHWWAVPGEEGATIEFAAVGLHDEFSIPE